MITEKENIFLQYWETNRVSLSTFSSKVARGLPMALLFTLPVILFIAVIWLFFPEWYMKISKTSPGMFITAIFALFLVTLFYAYFRMQYKWEMNEQLYKELIFKKGKVEKDIPSNNFADIKK
jgi:hypothetical protein